VFSRITLKDHLRETQLFSSRVVVALLVIIILVIVLVVRLIYLQILNHEHYSTLSQNNRVNIVAVPPTRGLIFDRHGVVLAQNLPSFSLEVVIEKVPNLAQMLDDLKQIITLEERDIKRFDKLRKRTASFNPVPLRFNLNSDEVARFSVRQHLFPGVDVHARLIRHYPLGELGVHALGYVGRISESDAKKLDSSNYKGTTHVGKNGIEEYYESTLHGTVGYRHVEMNAQGRVLRVLSETRPVPGKNLVLSLDIDVQSEAEAALAGQKGAVVAMDPKTGALIALASVPTFNPNSFVNGIDSEEYDALSKSTERPLFNRAIRGHYPPGSTIKPMVGLAALEYGVLPSEKKIYCPGWYSLKNSRHRYRDWKRRGHGSMNMEGAVRESCDVYFYDLAFHLGIDRMSTFLKQLGLGNYTGIDMHGEKKGLIPTRQWKKRHKNEPWYRGETLITGIGQGFNLTSPLQLALATAALANYGVHYKPKLGAYTQDQLTGEIQYLDLVVNGQAPVVSKAHWDQVIHMMERVVHSPRGTARRIGLDAPYKIAGKTGTAQVFSIKQNEKYIKEEVPLHLRDHALFIAIAPVEDPQIIVAVLVENGGSGSSVAAPIARRVLDQYLLKTAL